MLAAIFLYTLGGNALETFVTTYLHEALGVPQDRVTATLLPYMVASILFAIPAGYIGQWIGRRNSLMIGLGGSAIVFVVMYFVRDVTALTVLMPVFGVLFITVIVTALPLVVEMGGTEHTGALDGLDRSVAAGEVHGLLGPNGAGKSTTIRILLGLYRPSGGTARLFGRDPGDDPASLHRRLAYVPGDVTLWPTLSGGEAIDLLIRLRGGTPDRSDRERLIEAFELDPTKPIRTYSKGNRQKVALVAAFALPTELYILDEPTSGLDPLMEQRFQNEVVLGAAGCGAAVLLSSHILPEVEELADRVSIVRKGRRVETGTLAALRHLTASRYAVEGELDATQLERLEHIAGPMLRDGDTVSFSVERVAVQRVLSVLAASPVRSLTVAPPSLEELFLRHYGEDLTTADAPLPNGEDR